MWVARTLKTDQIFSVDVKQLVLCFCNWFSFWVSVASIRCQSCAWLAANAAAAWCLLRCSVGIYAKNRRALLISAIVGFFPRREKNNGCRHRRQSQRRETWKWDSATGGPLISCLGPNSPRWQCSPSQNSVHTGGDLQNGMALNQSSPQPGSQLKTCGISLGALLMPEWPTQQRWLTWVACWLKTCDAIPQQRLSRSLWVFLGWTVCVCEGQEQSESDSPGLLWNLFIPANRCECALWSRKQNA